MGLFSPALNLQAVITYLEGAMAALDCLDLDHAADEQEAVRRLRWDALRLTALATDVRDSLARSARLRPNPDGLRLSEYPDTRRYIRLPNATTADDHTDHNAELLVAGQLAAQR